MAEVGVGTALLKKRRGLKNFGVNNFEKYKFYFAYSDKEVPKFAY